LSKGAYKALLRKQRTMQRTKQAFAASAAVLQGPVSSDDDSVQGLAMLDAVEAGAAAAAEGSVGQMEGGSSGFGVVQGGAGGSYDPFSTASRYYHIMPPEDPYGEKTLDNARQARAGGAGRDGGGGGGCGCGVQGWFLARRSNSDPFTAVRCLCVCLHPSILTPHPSTLYTSRARPLSPLTLASARAPADVGALLIVRLS